MANCYFDRFCRPPRCPSEANHAGGEKLMAVKGSDQRTAPSGIEQLHLDDGFHEFLVGSLGFWLTSALG